MTDGQVKVNSVRRYDTAGGEMTPVAFTAELGATVTIDPGTWRFELWKVPNGRGGYLSGSDAVQIKTVPASGGPYQVDDLEETTVTGEAVTATPDWQIAIAAIQAQLDALVITGGGIPAAVDSVFTDATTFGKARLKDVDASAARTALNVAVLGTTTGTAADGGVVATLSTTVGTKAVDTA